MAIKLRALMTFLERGTHYIVAGDVFEVGNEYQAEAYVVKGLAEYVSDARHEDALEDEAEAEAAAAAAAGELPPVIENETVEPKTRKRKGAANNGE